MALRSLADGALFAEAYGEGPPRVLALHGWGRRGRDFGACLEGLPSLALDLPGFGASPPPVEAMGADGYADIVARALPDFEEPPVLVGHSFGGRVAVCLAARLPGATGPLVLTGVPLRRARPPTAPSVGYRLRRAMNRAGFLTDRRMERIRRDAGSPDYRAASGVMRQVLVRVLNETYEPWLRQIRSPVRLVWGGSDREVPLSVARWAVDVIRDAGGDATLDVVEGVGHHLPREAPRELRRAIQSLLG